MVVLCCSCMRMRIYTVNLQYLYVCVCVSCGAISIKPNTKPLTKLDGEFSSHRTSKSQTKVVKISFMIICNNNCIVLVVLFLSLSPVRKGWGCSSMTSSELLFSCDFEVFGIVQGGFYFLKSRLFYWTTYSTHVYMYAIYNHAYKYVCNTN